MQELIDMGIDVSKASMCWIINNSKLSDWEYALEPNEDIEFWTGIGLSVIPVFTLQDILEMLPDSILGSTKQIKTVEFKLSTRGNKVYYMQDNFNQQWLKCTNENTLLEAAFNMLKWCKQNNYI